MALETALAKASMDVTSRRDPHAVYHIMTIAQLSELAPAIDWPSYIAQTGVTGIGDLNVAVPDFFKGMQAVIESTDLDTIKAYLRWQLITSIPGYAMPTAMDDENFDFFGRKLTGQQEQRALEALHRGDRERTGRGSRSGLCRIPVPSIEQGLHPANGSRH